MEEAPVVVTAATGALGPVVAKLSTLLRWHGEYKLRRGTRKDIKLVRSKLKSIHSILWVIWEREDLDAAGKQLRMEAWRLADDMNDAIDDFILTMERSNDGKRFMRAKNQPSPFEDLKQRTVDMYERCRNRWKMETSHTTLFSSLLFRTKTTVNSGPGKRRTQVVDPYVNRDISKLVGMGDPRDKLIDHLVGEEDSSPQLKMACIVGPAGMGKTTLARLVYEAIEYTFEARAFVSVTSSHNMREVLASIYQQVQVPADSTVVPLAGTKPATAEKHLIDVISNFLKDKRYLVIIDDIWHCGEWETIKKSLPDNNLGSRIVTTSRVNAITDKWRDDIDALVHKIDRYSGFTNEMIEMNAHMFGEGFEPKHPIVDMCFDMPLAVTCMMSALAKERERHEQQGLCVVRTRDVQDTIEMQVKRNGIQNTPGFQPLVESLELGYNHLPHHMLKTCLLYCSIYPERHHFRRDDLVRRWIAEGFVCEEAAEDYFDKLVSRGLFLEFVNVYQRHGCNYLYMLHPMMRNYLRRKLREDDFITFTSDGVPSSPVGRLCIDDNWLTSDSVDEETESLWPSSDSAEDPLSGIDWQHIRSLVVFKDAERVPYKHLQHLRVLDIEGNKAGLENQHLKDMCGLLRLRHLFVTGAYGFPRDGISEIPADIKRLKYLETLEVTGTKITRLPAEIGDLKQLKTLGVSYNKGLAELPREMWNLQHILERLRIRGSSIREQAWEIIGTLKKLKTLDVCNNPELSGIPRDIGKLQQLKNLDVSYNRGITELPMEIGKLQNLETLDASKTGITELPPEIGNLQQLEALYLHDVELTKLPKEIGELQNLETLDASKTGITELPPEIGNLQQLEALYLHDVELTKLPREIGKLQHLETLDLFGTHVSKIPREIGGLKKLNIPHMEYTTLHFAAGQLSKLEGLPECIHKAGKNSDLMSSLAGEILSFQPITLVDEDGGLTVGTKHMHIPQWIKEHFNNIGTLDIRICKVEEQDLKILREMPNLLRLRIRFEAVPRKPIAISSAGFAKLVNLTVDCRVPRITFQEGAMPRLFVLEFEFQFYGGPPNTDHPMGIKHLTRLRYVNFRCNEWYRGDSPCISATIDVVRKEAKDHPNKIELEVQVEDDETFPENKITQSSQDRNEACSSSGAEEMEEIPA